MKNISKIGMQCVGCRSCEQTCPNKCIRIEENKEGFLYPTVDYSLCVDCGCCLERCPVEKNRMHRNSPLEVWAWKNKNETEIMKSASGGAADIASKTILGMGGVVYGAAYDDDFVVSHTSIDNEDDRYKLQSSKYVQSDSKNTYSQVKKNLSDGKIVLYTGTPCQISGLYAFLGGDKDNLYTIDLICHGVPSPKFFRKYIEYQNKLLGEKIISFNFRSKEKRGWGTQYLLKTKTKTKTKTLSLDRYGNHFMKADCYRECCYQCLYANTNRIGDLTVGDFWGIAKSHPEFDSPKGVSSVFINTEKGKILFNSMKRFGYVKKATLEEGMEKQGNLVRPSRRPKGRDEFYKNIENDLFVKKLKVDFQLKERLKVILPASAIRFIKRFSR